METREEGERICRERRGVQEGGGMELGRGEGEWREGVRGVVEGGLVLGGWRRRGRGGDEGRDCMGD